MDQTVKLKVNEVGVRQMIGSSIDHRVEFPVLYLDALVAIRARYEEGKNNCQRRPKAGGHSNLLR
jgi:hypothetical protein